MRYNRTNPAIVAYGIYLYLNSRSYRCTSKSLEYIIKRSHVSIWKWVQKNASIADHLRVYKHKVKEIFVDETLIQIDGNDYWLWIAYEPNVQRCLMMHMSRERTIFVCYYSSSFNSGKDYGFEVDSYNELLAALTNFKPNYYDLVILDIKIPEMTNFNLWPLLHKLIVKILWAL